MDGKPVLIHGGFFSYPFSHLGGTDLLAAAVVVSSFSPF